MKWVAIIALALALYWVWRNQRRLGKRLRAAFSGSSKLSNAETGKNGLVPSSAANSPTLVDAKDGPDPYPSCSYSNLCG